MAVDELSTIGANRGITVDSGTFNLRPIPFGWTIIDSHQESVGFFVNQLYHKFKQYSGNCFSFLPIEPMK